MPGPGRGSASPLQGRGSNLEPVTQTPRIVDVTDPRRLERVEAAPRDARLENLPETEPFGIRLRDGAPEGAVADRRHRAAHLDPADLPPAFGGPVHRYGGGGVSPQDSAVLARGGREPV